MISLATVLVGYFLVGAVVVHVRAAGRRTRGVGEWLLLLPVWPLLLPFAGPAATRASDAQRHAGVLDRLIAEMIVEIRPHGFASLEPALRSLRARVVRAAQRIDELDTTLERIRGSETGSRAPLDRLVELRRRELAELERLEQLLVTLRAQIAVAVHDGHDHLARELADEVWARVAAFETAFGAPEPQAGAEVA